MRVREAGAVRPSLVPDDDVVDDQLHIECSPFQDDLAGFDLGEIEDVIDQAIEWLAVAFPRFAEVVS